MKTVLQYSYARQIPAINRFFGLLLSPDIVEWKILQIGGKGGKDDEKTGQAGAGDTIVIAASGRICGDAKAYLGQRVAD